MALNKSPSKYKREPDLLVLSNPILVAKICSYLSYPDLKECLAVSRKWRSALMAARLNCMTLVTGPSLRAVTSGGQTLKDHIQKENENCSKMIVNGWDHICQLVPDEFYNTLIDNPNSLKKLVLRGKGEWTTCRCPKNTKGLQVTKIPKDKLTNIEVLIIEESFTISSCALLYVISISPKLKQLTFHGRIRRHDHLKGFACQVIQSNIKRFYWPFPTKKDASIINFLVKHNDMIETIHSSMEIICDLLSSESLPRLRNLSLNLIEDWTLSERKDKVDISVKKSKAFEHLDRTKNLASAKNLEAIEIRTYILDFPEEEEKESRRHIEHIFENYKLSFWENLAKLPKLKYVCVYGGWDLDGICNALAKHGFGIEFLRTNCIPKSLMEVIYDDQNDNILAMAPLMRDLRKLTTLRSLHYHCAEKLFNIDAQTIGALKELIDKLWFLNIKTTQWTPEVEDFLNSVIKRGNQCGKTFCVDVLVEPNDEDLAHIVMTLPLKLPSGTSLKGYIVNNARAEIRKRYPRRDLKNIYCWGVRWADMPRDRTTYEAIKLNWNKYRDIFDPTSYGC